MGMKKYASFEVSQILDVKGSKDRARTASFSKVADFDDFRTEDGYLYARIRAISSRVNKNHDGWPSVELAGSQDIFDQHRTAGTDTGFTVEASAGNAHYGFATFIGKPIFVDHHNSNPDRARGVIVDAKLHVEDHKTSALDPYYAADDCDPLHKPATWVELLLEVDAKSFPRLAKAIIEGSTDAGKGIDGFSMGCDVEKSVCNICKNAAVSPDQFCEHIRLKGASFNTTDHNGRRTSRKSYENCYGIKFFEISAVFDPADETALIREVRAGVEEESLGRTASVKVADNPEPQMELETAPEDVDTLRDEAVCPVCGSEMDDETCEICGHIEPPEGLNNPDLAKAQEADLRQEGGEEEHNAEGEDTLELGPESEGGAFTDPAKTPGKPAPTRNLASAAHVSHDMSWSEHVRQAGRINPVERPILPGSPVQSDEPAETVIRDQDRPITSRTANEFIEAATNKDTMNTKTADAASGAPAVAKPDVRTDVTGVGGFADASAEAASAPDARTNLEGKGGLGTSDVSADTTWSVDTSGGDNAGFDTKKNIPAQHTETFGPGSSAVERQADPVTGDTFPASDEGVHKSHTVEAHDDSAFPAEDGGLAGGSAQQGVEPADPMGKAQDRVDVLEHVTSPANNSGPTTTWGDGTSAVTRQAPAVTNESIATEDVTLKASSSQHIFAALRLAETEVELGLIPESEKWSRASELENTDPREVVASLKFAHRVKTAGLAKPTAKTAKRLPSLSRQASRTEASAPQSEAGDESLFM